METISNKANESLEQRSLKSFFSTSKAIENLSALGKSISYGKIYKLWEHQNTLKTREFNQPSSIRYWNLVAISGDRKETMRAAN